MESLSLSLSALYARALGRAARASSMPTIEDETQEQIQDALADLVQLTSRVANLSLFSSNEVLDDVSTPDLVYLSLPFIRAEVQNRVRATDRDERMRNLAHVQRHLSMYIASIETYGIMPETERALYNQQPSSIRDAAKRRELKIRQYKTEKDLRTRVEVIKRRRRQLLSEGHQFSDFELVASLLHPTPLRSDDDAEDLETEDILREATVLLLRLFYAQACAQLESVDQEIQLLRDIPPPPLVEPPVEEHKTKDEVDAWKIEETPKSFNGPLLDPHGKPLRPFTILPASTSDRMRLHAQAFRPDYRLPTMSIDEYLEIEWQRGGILSSGGPQSETKPTTSEQSSMDSETGGTVLEELKAEEKRHQDEQWARYKDTHPRGAGNTMNRG